MGVPIITGLGEKRKRGRTPSKGWSGGSTGGGIPGSGGSWLGYSPPSSTEDDTELPSGPFTVPDDSNYWLPPEAIESSTFFPDEEPAEEPTEDPQSENEFGLRDSGISPDWMAPPWWDDPNTPDDEWQDYIYKQVGGWDGTNLTKEEFFSDQYHKDSFARWEESGHKTKYDNVLTQLDMLNEKFTREEAKYDVDLEALNLESQTNLTKFRQGQENLSEQSEVQFRSGGGGASGRALQSIKSASKNLNQALSLESRNINLNKNVLEIAYDDTLDKLETNKMDFVDDLITIEDEYESKLVNLVDSMNIEPQGDTAEDRAGLPDYDTDKDGTISEEEALAGQAATNEAAAEAELEAGCEPCLNNCNEYIVQFQDWQAPAGGPTDLPTSYTQAEIESFYNNCIQNHCPECG